MPSGKSLPNIHIITPYTNLHLPEKGGGGGLCNYLNFSSLVEFSPTRVCFRRKPFLILLHL